jgi:hypothetical protein
MKESIIFPNPFLVDFTTSRPVLVDPVDPGWSDRALEVSGALLEAVASPSAPADFSCGGSATTTIIVIVLGLIVALVIAISLAIKFRRRAVEAEISIKSR